MKKVLFFATVFFTSVISSYAQSKPVIVNSSESVDIIATEISLDNRRAVRTIDIYDRNREEVFETFTHEVVSDNDGEPLADQLRSGHFSGWIYLKQLDEEVFAYRITDGQEDREQSRFLGMDPDKCTWKILRRCVTSTIDDMFMPC